MGSVPTQGNERFKALWYPKSGSGWLHDILKGFILSRLYPFSPFDAVPDGYIPIIRRMFSAIVRLLKIPPEAHHSKLTQRRNCQLETKVHFHGYVFE